MAWTRPASSKRAVARRPVGANPPGNERLTAITGAVLLVLFAAEVVTTLLMGSAPGTPVDNVTDEVRPLHPALPARYNQRSHGVQWLHPNRA